MKGFINQVNHGYLLRRILVQVKWLKLKKKVPKVPKVDVAEGFILFLLSKTTRKFK
jgi:hypothetical protein